MAKQTTKAKRGKAAPSADGTTMREVLAAIATLSDHQRSIDQAAEELAYFPNSYAAAANEFITALANFAGPVPFERAEAMIVACRVAQIFRQWEHDQADEWPPQTYYALRERLDELVRLPSERTPSPKLLAQRGTQVRQIAVIWGLFSGAGTPDVDRVERLISGQEKLPDDYEAADAQRAITEATEAIARLKGFVSETSVAVPRPELSPDDPAILETTELNAEQEAAALDMLRSGTPAAELAKADAANGPATDITPPVTSETPATP